MPEPSCIECGVSIPYSGKGRPPKYCASHNSHVHQTGKSERDPEGNARRNAGRMRRKRAISKLDLAADDDALILQMAAGLGIRATPAGAASAMGIQASIADIEVLAERARAMYPGLIGGEREAQARVFRGVATAAAVLASRELHLISPRDSGHASKAYAMTAELLAPRESTVQYADVAVLFGGEEGAADDEEAAG